MDYDDSHPVEEEEEDQLKEDQLEEAESEVVEQLVLCCALEPHVECDEVVSRGIIIQ